MTNAIPDLTPPSKGNSSKSAKKTEKPKVSSGEKKERAPRTNYGYAKDAVIKVTDKESKFRGQRGEWYGVLKANDGKAVSAFEDSAKAKNLKDPPRGWLRFFVQEGYATLSGGTTAVPDPKVS